MVEIKEVAGGASSSSPSDSTEATSTTTSNDVSVQHANGEAVAEQQAPQQNAQEPSRMESFFAITKSLILRALIIYFITSFFRRPAATPEDTAGGAASPAAKLPSFNYFENGSIMVNDEF